MLKKSIILLALFAAFFAYSSCSSDEPNDKLQIDLTAAETDIMNTYNDLAFKLLDFRNNNEVDNNSNIAIAPYSLTVSLSMASNYAQGDDFERLKKMLGFNQIDDLNTLNNKLLHSLPYTDSKVTLSISNSAWIHPDFVRYFPESFESTLSDSYNAPTYKTDLSSTGGINSLNQWCSNATNGLISQFFNEPVGLKMLVLNANYFHGEWKNKFDESETAPRAFTCGDGSKRQIKTMHASLNAEALFTPELSMLSLPYGNGSFKMNFILPAENSSINEMLKDLNGNNWKKMLANKSYYYNIKISIPKFKLNYTADFLDLFQSTEIENQTGASGAMPISFVKQMVYIETDEKGTTAAVVSGTGSEPTANPDLVFNVDRPFIFIIDEAQTGSILFAGIIRNP